MPPEGKLQPLGNYCFKAALWCSLHPEQEGHIATWWLPPDVWLTQLQMNACAPRFTHGNAPHLEPDFQ